MILLTPQSFIQLIFYQTSQVIMVRPKYTARCCDNFWSIHADVLHLSGFQYRSFLFSKLMLLSMWWSSGISYRLWWWSRPSRTWLSCSAPRVLLFTLMLPVLSRRFYWWNRRTGRQCKAVWLSIFRNDSILFSYFANILTSFRVRSDDLATVAQDLLVNLFAVLSMPASKENEYVMKGNNSWGKFHLVVHTVRSFKNEIMFSLAIMRYLSTLQAAVAPFVGQLLTQLTNILLVVAKNPSKPHFNHYLFESISLLVRNVCKQNPQAVSDFEVALFPIFQQILQQDVAGTYAHA